jgi:tetratricopeptide (TPR) repeat protein
MQHARFRQGKFELCVKAHGGLHMTRESLIHDFFSAFAASWDSPRSISEFEALLQKANQADDKPLIVLAEARLEASKGNPENALQMLDSIESDEQYDWLVKLMRARILDVNKEDHQQALSICNDLIEKDCPVDTFKDVYYAFANFMKGVALGQMDKLKQAIDTFDMVIEKFGARQDLPLAERVAKSLVNKGVALGRMDKPQQAIDTCDMVIEKYGERKELPLAEMVARAISIRSRNSTDNTKTIDLLLEIPVLFKNVTPESDSYLMNFFSRVPGMLPVSDAELESDKALKWKNVIDFALEKTGESEPDKLSTYLSIISKQIPKEKEEEYFNKIEESKRKTDRFIKETSRFAPDARFLMVLREWNSYTPTLPVHEERDRGGGYFIRFDTKGIVIDPGYDFIENFERAGGRLCDIDNIIVTHAHDDHTAELEPLLMLLHRFRTDKQEHEDAGYEQAPEKQRSAKRISLYLSASARKKFFGLLNNRDEKYQRIITLHHPEKKEHHEIQISAHVKLTVLPAFHDDVISANQAVGLCLDFTLDDSNMRRIVFTGDSGMYPKKINKDGSVETYKYEDGNGKTREEPELDNENGNALCERYSEILSADKTHLLVAHIGAIKKREFQRSSSDSSPLETLRSEKSARRFYVDHLGLLGTFMLVHNINPEAAIISEFGAEMKEFRIQLVQHIDLALKELRKTEKSNEKTLVVPSDTTIVYDIDKGQFLCHEINACRPCEELQVQTAKYRKRKFSIELGRYEAIETPGETDRVHLFSKEYCDKHHDATRFNVLAKDFWEKFYNCELYYHKVEPGSGS